MPKYKIYQVGKLLPLTTIESDSFGIDIATSTLIFYNDNKEAVATFNWNNIAGFKRVIKLPDTVPEVAQND